MAKIGLEEARLVAEDHFFFYSLRPQDGAEEVAALLMVSSDSVLEEEIEFFIDRCEVDPDCYGGLVLVCALFITKGRPIPESLRPFCRDVLRDSLAPPKSKKTLKRRQPAAGEDKNRYKCSKVDYRNQAIVKAIFELVYRYGFAPDRNFATDTTSAIDIVAEEFSPVLGGSEKPSEKRGDQVRGAWNDFRKVKTGKCEDDTTESKRLRHRYEPLLMEFDEDNPPFTCRSGRNEGIYEYLELFESTLEYVAKWQDLE